MTSNALLMCFVSREGQLVWAPLQAPEDGGLPRMSPVPLPVRAPLSLEGLPGSDGDAGKDGISLSLLFCDGLALFVTSRTEQPVFENQTMPQRK